MEETAKRILEISPFPAALARGGTLEYCNPCLLRLLGLQKREAEGRQLAVFVREQEKEAQSVLASVSAGGAWPASFRACFVSAGGEDRHFEVIPSPMSGGETILFFRDQTDLRITEQALEMALQDSESRIYEVAENLDQGVWLMDVASKKYLCRNPAFFRITGAASGSSAEKSWLPVELVHPDDLSAVSEVLSRPFSGRIECSFRIIRPSDGEVRWLRSRAFPIFDGAGALVRIAGITEDITAAKHAEQLREDVERITRHDLKSPLSSIISVPSFMLDREDIPQEQKQWWQTVRDAGNRMLRMINSSLNLYKMEVGTFRLQPAEVDLSRVLDEAARDLAGVLSAYRVTLSVEKPEGCFPVIAGDSLLVYELLSNLLKNAAEASPQGGPVKASFSCSAGRVELALHNSGVIPREIRGKFFQKYVTSGKTHGTGLGAYSARLITVTLGGTIGFESAEETGTTMRLVFPDFGSYCSAQEKKA